jgi:ABC-2 type transport system permease protein
MRSAWIICRRELNSYFSSPIAWLLLTMYSVIFGFFFWNYVGNFVIESVEMQMTGQMQPMNINEQIIRPLLANISFLAIFFVPLITMRLFAEEKRSGTIELLATSPVRDIEIILGKWFAATLLYCWLLIYSGINFAFLFRYGHPDWKPMLVAYLGLLLQGAALLAIGTFISTLTKNQIVAAASTFAACLMLWVFAWVSSYDSSTWATVLSYLSVITHFESFGRGVLQSKDAIYYLSVIFLGLFFTARSMESLRWRS